MSRAARRLAVVGLSTLALWSSVAQAHVGNQSVVLLAGALHPWLTPASALVLIALVLWQCQHAPSTDLWPFALLGACLTVGAALGLWLPIHLPAWAVELLALALAACVSLAVLPGRMVWLGTHATAALLSGVFAGIDATRDVFSPALFLAGVLAGGLVIPLAAGLVLVDRPWPLLKVAVRIAASWVAALALVGVALQVASQRT